MPGSVSAFMATRPGRAGCVLSSLGEPCRVFCLDGSIRQKRQWYKCCLVECGRHIRMLFDVLFLSRVLLLRDGCCSVLVHSSQVDVSWIQRWKYFFPFANTLQIWACCCHQIQSCGDNEQISVSGLWEHVNVGQGSLFSRWPWAVNVPADCPLNMRWPSLPLTWGMLHTPPTHSPLD